NWVSVCWSAELGLFCAVATTGTGNRVMTSPDGINWTIGTSGADNTWSSGCWSAELGQFCAVGLSGTGNRVMASSSAHLYWPAHPSVSASLSAAGTTQATARALTSAVSILTTVASGSGVVLALSDPGTRQEVLNRGANALLVYPPSGAQIEAAGTDTAVSLPAGGRAAFLCASATQFYQT
ncbi:hypothetical protein, partial [Enterovirga sp.]|uniref:hypothetical protein n=1 Tax=Enterovirga sp. TaxID=2026350 RepID=UPI002B6240C0